MLPLGLISSAPDRFLMLWESCWTHGPPNHWLVVSDLDQRFDPLEPRPDGLHHLIESGARLVRARLDAGETGANRLRLLQAGDRLLGRATDLGGIHRQVLFARHR